MQPLDENPSRSEAFLRESIKLASEALIEAEVKHKKEIQVLISSMVEKHEGVRETLENELSELRHSRSWRFTKPLRIVYAFFSRKD